MGQNWHIPHCGAAWTQCHGRDTQYLGQKAKKYKITNQKPVVQRNLFVQHNWSCELLNINCVL